ncbi:glycerol-3-phosphate dehydrogenase [Ruegeria sp. 2205SS24-7]|uniref:glycerol-3-phosphate dehydrogenase n=1 Tax=Ruegeria discodermiae TaxID=3064389 RepID=UPI002740C1C4|nr:glycerol-3-phosphate dehydrogenase [Ruegeria sp. 2205SS24-7]MDP5220963.1 glycerol-3-phosphate dehydrogenase [Ruegeria sp. 2205SS24-7]
MDEPFDLVVIGGGINGAGTARDAAGRGLRVLLAEKDDLAQGTSSRSGKYIHGGLRYLEYYEFRLVREALIEREVILNTACHLAWPIRLLLVHSPQQRPRWLIRLGLFLYDNLGGRKRIPGTRGVDLSKVPEGRAIKDAYRRAFAYYDVWVDDARLVVLNAVDAARRGAKVLTRTAVTHARREDGLWRVGLNGPDGPQEVRARALFNAAGPWVEQAIGQIAGVNSSKRIRLVKGSHLIIKRWWEGDHGFVLQASDKRIIFVNPYFDDLALVGTTDIPFEGQPEDVAIDADETRYLLDILNLYFRVDLSADDVLSAYSGVRPLFDDDAAKGASAVTRDYTFEMDGGDDRAPLLSAFGGKLTTYRKLSEAALEHLAPYFPAMGAAWTDGVPLPGGDIPNAEFGAWFETFCARFPWLGADLARHYARCYGTDAIQMLDGASGMADLGAHFGGLFYAREAEWLKRNEWAQTAQDMLERRTKHALFMTDAEQQAVGVWLDRMAAA